MLFKTLVTFFCNYGVETKGKKKAQAEHCFISFLVAKPPRRGQRGSMFIDRPWRAAPLSSQCPPACRWGRSPKRRGKFSAALAVSLPRASVGRLPNAQDTRKRWSGPRVAAGYSAGGTERSWAHRGAHKVLQVPLPQTIPNRYRQDPVQHETRT